MQTNLYTISNAFNNWHQYPFCKYVFRAFFALVSSLVITSSPIFSSICWGEDYKEINDLLQLIINLLKNLATISDGMYCTNYYTHSKDVSPIIKLEFCDGKLLRHFNNTMWSDIYIRLVVLAISNLVATTQTGIFEMSLEI